MDHHPGLCCLWGHWTSPHYQRWTASLTEPHKAISCNIGTEGGFAESDLLMGLNKDWNRMLMLTYHMRHRSTTDPLGALNVQSREIYIMKRLRLNRKYRERLTHEIR